MAVLSFVFTSLLFSQPFLFFDTARGAGVGYEIGDLEVWGGYPYFGVNFDLNLVLLELFGDIGLDLYTAQRGWTEFGMGLSFFNVKLTAIGGGGYDLLGSAGEEEPQMVGYLYYGAQILYTPPEGLNFGLKATFPIYDLGYLASSGNFIFYPVNLLGEPIPAHFEMRLSYVLKGVELGGSYSFSIANVVGYPSPLINLQGVRVYLKAYGE